MFRRGFLIGALTLLSACDRAEVAYLNYVTTTKFVVDGERLYMNGEINAKTLDQFEEVMEQNPQVRVLIEEEVPGSLDDDTMIELAYRVREYGLDTYLTSESNIASGGVDLFLAGVNRIMERGAAVGVHSWQDGIQDAKDYPRDAPEHEMNRKYIEDMLGSDDFYWFTIYAAPAADIYQMSESEIIKYGLVTEPIR